MALNENPTLVQIVDEIERLDNLIVDRGGARTITPSTYNQILSKGNYKGDITILGDNDLLAENIKKGVSIFGVNGAFEGGIKWASGRFENPGTRLPNKTFRYTSGRDTTSFYAELQLPFYPRYLIGTFENSGASSSAGTITLADLPNPHYSPFCSVCMDDGRGASSMPTNAYRFDESINVGNGMFHIPTRLNIDYLDWIAFE